MTTADKGESLATSSIVKVTPEPSHRWRIQNSHRMDVELPLLLVATSTLTKFAVDSGQIAWGQQKICNREAPRHFPAALFPCLVGFHPSPEAGLTPIFAELDPSAVSSRNCQ